MYIVGGPGSERRNFGLWSIHAKSWDSMGSVWRSPLCWRAWSHSIHRHANRDVGRAAHSRSQSVYLDGLISCLFDFRDYSRHRSRRCFHHRRPDLDVRRTIRSKAWPARGVLRSNPRAPWHCPRCLHARCSSSCEGWIVSELATIRESSRGGSSRNAERWHFYRPTRNL